MAEVGAIRRNPQTGERAVHMGNDQWALVENVRRDPATGDRAVQVGGQWMALPRRQITQLEAFGINALQGATANFADDIASGGIIEPVNRAVDRQLATSEANALMGAPSRRQRVPGRGSRERVVPAAGGTIALAPTAPNAAQQQRAAQDPQYAAQLQAMLERNAAQQAAQRQGLIADRTQVRTEARADIGEGMRQYVERSRQDRPLESLLGGIAGGLVPVAPATRGVQAASSVGRAFGAATAPVSRAVGAVPGVRQAGQALGSVGQAAGRLPVVGGAIRAAPEAIATVGRGASVGAAYGGLAGLGETFDEDPQVSGVAAATGAAQGAVGGAALGALGRYVGQPLTRYFRSTPEQRGRDMVLKRFERDDVPLGPQGPIRRTPPPEYQGSLRQRATVAQANQDRTSFLAEMGGTATRGLGRAIVNVGGDAATRAQEALVTRGRGQLQRVQSQIMRTFGMDARDFGQAQQRLREARNAPEVRDAYARAYQDPPMDPQVFARDVAPVLLSDTGQDALRGAARLADSQLDNVTRGELREALALVRQGRAPQTMSIKALDLVERGLRQMTQDAFRQERGDVANALERLQQQVRAPLDVASSALARARSMVADPYEIERALTAGTRAMNVDVDPVDIGQALQQLSPAERQAYMLGALRNIRLKLIRTRDRSGTQDSTSSLIGSESQREKLEALLPPLPPNATTAQRAAHTRAANQLMLMLEREANQAAYAASALSGSRTAPLAREMQEATEGEGGVGPVADFLAQAWEASQSPRGAMAALGRGMQAASNYGAGINNPRIAAEAQRLLFAQSPAARMDAVRTLQDRAVQRATEARANPIGNQLAALGGLNAGTTEGRNTDRGIVSDMILARTEAESASDAQTAAAALQRLGLTAEDLRNPAVRQELGLD